MEGRSSTGSTEAALLLADAHQHSAMVFVFGHEVEVTFRWDRNEPDRRSDHGLGALTEPEVLRALMALPANLPVPTDQLDPLDRLVLDELPPGAVDDLGTHLVRRALPPVELVGVAKRVHSWEDVQKLSLLRTHAPRLAIASRSLADRIVRTCDPDMGVAVVTDDCVTMERNPGRRWVRPSWQRWLVAEMVFAVAVGSQPVTLSQA